MEIPMHQIKSSWNDLPIPLLIKIVKYLQLKDVISCSEVCASWSIVCEDQLLWKYLLHRDFRDKKDKRGFIYLALVYCSDSSTITEASMP